MEGFMLSPIIEGETTGIVDEGFRRGIFREDQRVVIEFDVIINELSGHTCLAYNR
jgi:hypothetical protein